MFLCRDLYRTRNRRGPLLVGGALAFSLLLGSSARAQTHELFCVLDGHQETPFNTSTGTGGAVLTIDTVANTLDYNITFTGTTSATNNAHIHGPAIPGVPGGILEPLPSFNSPIIGTWNFDDLEEVDILEGRTYINIHTVTFSAGELRGQIIHGGQTVDPVSYCWGDGSDTACPCNNNDDSPGRGCRNSTTIGGMLIPHEGLSASADDLQFTAENLIVNQTALLFSGATQINGGAGVLFGDGLRCSGGPSVRLETVLPATTANAAGIATWGPGLGVKGGWAPGDTRHFQVWYSDPSGGPCVSGFNVTNGITITFAP